MLYLRGAIALAAAVYAGAAYLGWFLARGQRRDRDMP